MYKVVTHQLKSVFARDEALSLQYWVNRWTYPTIPNSLLFAFELLTCAKNFCDWMACVHIYECELEDMESAPAQVLSLPDFGCECGIKVMNYWNPEQQVTGSYTACSPEGSVCAKGIKLIKKVYPCYDY